MNATKRILIQNCLFFGVLCPAYQNLRESFRFCNYSAAMGLNLVVTSAGFFFFWLSCWDNYSWNKMVLSDHLFDPTLCSFNHSGL